MKLNWKRIDWDLKEAVQIRLGKTIADRRRLGLPAVQASERRMYAWSRREQDVRALKHREVVLDGAIVIAKELEARRARRDLDDRIARLGLNPQRVTLDDRLRKLGYVARGD